MLADEFKRESDGLSKKFAELAVKAFGDLQIPGVTFTFEKTPSPWYGHLLEMNRASFRLRVMVNSEHGNTPYFRLVNWSSVRPKEIVNEIIASRDSAEIRERAVKWWAERASEIEVVESLEREAASVVPAETELDVPGAAFNPRWRKTTQLVVERIDLIKGCNVGIIRTKVTLDPKTHKCLHLGLIYRPSWINIEASCRPSAFKRTFKKFLMEWAQDIKDR